MKTVIDYLAIVGAYCLGCIFHPYCQPDSFSCVGYKMTEIGMDMILRGDTNDSGKDT